MPFEVESNLQNVHQLSNQSGQGLDSTVLSSIGDFPVRAIFPIGARSIRTHRRRHPDFPNFDGHCGRQLVAHPKALRYQKSENPHREWV